MKAQSSSELSIVFDPEKDLHPHQVEALALLLKNDGPLNLMWGGALGGGKSALGTYACLLLAFSYPNLRILVARRQLNQLMESTAVSMFAWGKRLGIPLAQWFNKNERKLKLPNESEILFLNLDERDDPEFAWLGGYEFSFCYLDEGSEISHSAFRAVRERLRHGLTEHGLTPRVLITTNPSRTSWLFGTVYMCWKNGTLDSRTWAYLPCLPHQNPYLPEAYVRGLTPELLGVARHRIRVLGDWEFSEEGDLLFADQAAFWDCCTWSADGVDLKEPALSADVGGSGNNADKSVICRWEGLRLIEVIEREGLTVPQLVDLIRNLIAQHSIPTKNVVIDANGIGQGVSDLIRGSVPFRAHSKPLRGEFMMRKDELLYKLAELIGRKEIRFHVKGIEEQLLKELTAHKKFNHEKDQKQRVTPKEQVARALGHSPDLADAVYMRLDLLDRKAGLVIQNIDWSWQQRA